jgi:DNA-binding transcriptional MocR family regulator
MATDANTAGVAGAAPMVTGRPGRVAGVNQADPRPGMVELGPGYLDPTLLPVGLIRRCAARALDRWGAQALAYGANPGPQELRVALAARVADATGTRCGPDNVLTTAGTSAALDQIAISLARDGRAVLTECLTYDLGRDIFTGRGVRTVPVPGPLDDIDVAEFSRAAVRVARESGQPPALYLIPTFHNPTGRVLGRTRRREIMELAERLGMLVIEDQAYAELSYGTPPPPSLRSCTADPERVVSLYSLAKCLAPGMRVGWLVAGERLVSEFARDPVRLSGGGGNHFAVMVVAAACLEGEFDRHLSGLRGRLKARRDALLTAVADALPDRYGVAVPGGGFFAWVRLPPGVDDRRLVREAEARGVSFAPGRRFGTAHRGVRLCFAACRPADLRLGATRLLAALPGACPSPGG